jgi:hypothetical protein
MSEPLIPYTLIAPGFFGLNTQASPVDTDAKFALGAKNCVIDKYGRVGARKGWTRAHTVNADLGNEPIQSIGELVDLNGSSTILCAGNECLFKLGATTLTKLTYGGGGVAPTILVNNWQMACLNDTVVFFQRGYDPLIYDINVSTTQYRRVSEHASYAGTIPQGNCGISAYGRLWVADTSTESVTLKWSDLLSPAVWTGGSSGSLDIRSVLASGGDYIVALGAHNNKLFIFCRKQIVIYNNADDPANMVLEDIIANTGCVARDSVVNTGEDIIFLSDSGVRSVMRTIQEKSAPLSTVSRNVNDDVKAFYQNETSGASIKAVYSPIDAFYLLTFVESQVTYCFDTRSPMEDGSYRATTWAGINPQSFHYAKDHTLYIGKAGYLGKYDGYLDDTSTYRMSYYSTWIDFGNPVAISIFKKMKVTVVGTGNHQVIMRWAFDYQSNRRSLTTSYSNAPPSEYGTAEYNIAEYAGNYRSAIELSASGSGNGRVLQVGVESVINGDALSIQRIDVFAKEGRI